MAEQPPEICFGDGISDSALAAEYGSVSAKPPQRPELAFQIVLPKTWISPTDVETPALEFDKLSVLAAFAESPQVYVQVLGTILPWEVNLVDWLEYQAHLGEHTLTAVQSGRTDFGQMVHAEADAADGSKLRIMTTGDGPHVVMLVGRMPPDAPPRVKETLGLAAASFLFKSHSGKTTREPLKKYADKDGMFQLTHPESWACEPLDALRPDKAGVDLRATSEEDTVAFLRVEADKRIARSEFGFKRAYESIIDELIDTGIEPADMELVSSDEEMKRFQRYLGVAVLPEREGTLALLLRPAERAWLISALVCPAKTDNPYGWMRGKRAYELLVASLSEPPS